MRVPAIFWGSNIKSGVINDIGSTLDIYSTFLSVSGIEQQKNMLVDGLDLSKTLFESKESPRKDMFFYNGDELYAARLGNFKLHLKTKDWFKEPQTHHPPLLFNLNNDPSEKFNIAKENPEKVQEILNLIDYHNSKLVKGKDQLKNRF